VNYTHNKYIYTNKIRTFQPRGMHHVLVTGFLNSYILNLITEKLEMHV